MPNLQYFFGVGNAFIVPTSGTPVRFACLQEISFDIALSEKELYGQYQFPLTVARGKGKITGKAKNAEIDAYWYSQIAGGTVTTAATIVAFNEAATIPAPAGPYTVTVSHSATWVTDLGVIITATGKQMQATTGAVSKGLYSVAAGVYTFHSGDASTPILLSYTYTATTGQTLTFSNALMGVASSFALTLGGDYDSKSQCQILPKVISLKLTMPMKQEDFLVNDVDLAIMPDASGVLWKSSTTSPWAPTT